MPRKSHFGIANPSELPTAQTAMQYGIGAAEKKGLLPGAGLQRRAVQMRGGGRREGTTEHWPGCGYQMSANSAAGQR